MPDLLSHILFILIVCELINFRKKGLLLVGAILPDVITKLVLIGFIFNIPKELADALLLFHAIIPMFLLVVLVSLFFKDSLTALYLIFAGALSHILLDISQTHFLGGIRVLFPFTWKIYRLDKYWPDQYWMILTLFIVLYVIIKLYKKFKTKKIKTK